MTNEEKLIKYCKEYNVPIEYVFEILSDQKVVPMIRGKATEYNAYLFLKNSLDFHTWDVQKLNLNAQNNEYDEDVSITHRASGIRLKVECKNAVRGSASLGIRTRVMNVPHFKVKCHRSRSNIMKADSTNDRYLVGEFDLLVCNPSNSLYEGNTMDILEIIRDKNLMDYLYRLYNVQNTSQLIDKCNNDWRFVIPSDIAEDNVIPRTPYVKFENDDNWTTITNLENRLLRIVQEKRNTIRRSRR